MIRSVHNIIILFICLVTSREFHQLRDRAKNHTTMFKPIVCESYHKCYPIGIRSNAHFQSKISFDAFLVVPTCGHDMVRR